MKLSIKTILLVAGFSLASINLHAAPLVVDPNSLDTITGETQGSGNPLGYAASADAPATFGAGATIGVGGGFGKRANNNVVFGFLLPTLASGQSISSVTLSFEANNRNNQSFDGDLYGLGAADTTFNPDSSGTSLFLEANSDATQTIITGSLITPSNPSTASLPATVTADVSTFVTSLYTGTTPTGGRSEVFFRLNQDRDLTLGGVNRISLTDDASTVALTFNIVPEPTTFAMLLGGFGMLTLLRRRR